MKSRHFVVAFLALALGCLAVGVPLVLNFDQDVELERADLIAGTRDTYTIARAVPLVASIGAVVEGGQLSVEVARDKPITSQRVRQLVDRGLADLIIDRGVLRLGETITLPDDKQIEHPSLTMSALLRGKFLGLKLVRSTIYVTLPGGGNERFTRVRANFVRVGRSAIRGTGQAMWRGQTIKFALRSDGRVTASGLPFEIALGGSLVAFKLSGHAVSQKGVRIKGDSEIKIPDLRRLSRALGAHWPGHLNLQKVSLTGPFDWAGSALSFPKAKFEFNNNVGNGVLTINSTEGKAVISGTVAFDDFDLGACFGPVAGSSAEYSSALVSNWVNRLAGAWTMPMARYVDADLRVSAKNVRVGPTTIGSAATAITLNSGKVSINLAELAYEGGSGTGQLSVDFNGFIPQLTLRGRLTTAPLAQLSKAMWGATYASGQATLTADLIAYGDTLKQMLSNVSGTIDAEMPKGGALGVDLMALGKENAPLPGATQHPGGRKLIEHVLKGSTRFDSAMASLLLSGGRIRTSDARAEFRGHVAQLAGVFDTKLRQMELKMLVAPSPEQIAASHATRPGPKAPPSTVPVNAGVSGDLLVARGPWRAPQLELSRHHAESVGQLETLLRISPSSLLRTRM